MWLVGVRCGMARQGVAGMVCSGGVSQRKVRLGMAGGASHG